MLRSLSLKAGMVDQLAIIAAYRRYARHYDRLFGRVLDPGRKLVVKKMNCQEGDKILEVGVGTGLSFFFYPPKTSVVGIDLSPHMLAQAKQRNAFEGLCNTTLTLTDAENMSFGDNTFDKVAAMYVASVLPNPEAMVSEMKRVCKPGGQLFILNHFSNGKRLIRAFEAGLSPLSGILGFRTVFPIDEFISKNSLEAVEMVPVNAFGYWTLIHSRNGA